MFRLTCKLVLLITAFLFCIEVDGCNKEGEMCGRSAKFNFGQCCQGLSCGGNNYFIAPELCKRMKTGE